MFTTDIFYRFTPQMEIVQVVTYGLICRWLCVQNIDAISDSTTAKIFRLSAKNSSTSSHKKGYRSCKWRTLGR